MKNLKLFLLSISILFSSQAFSMGGKIIEYLKSPINVIDAWIDKTRTPLMRATLHNNPEMVKCVINYCQSNNIELNVNAKDYYTWTALKLAAQYKPEAIKYLALAGANLNQIKDEDFYPNQYQNALKEIKKWIFKNYPKDRNKVLSKIKFIALSGTLKLIRDSNGNTLLHYAAMKEDVQLFGLVYSICPSLIATTNNRNQTSVQLALGNEKIFELIKKLSLQNDNQANYNDKPKAYPCNLF